MNLSVSFSHVLLEVRVMHNEKQVSTVNGWVMLAVTILVFLVGAAVLREFVYSSIEAEQRHTTPDLYLLLGGVLVVGLGVFLCFGFFALQPNEGRVLILFGAYCGTERQAGWH